MNRLLGACFLLLLCGAAEARPRDEVMINVGKPPARHGDIVLHNAVNRLAPAEPARGGGALSAAGPCATASAGPAQTPMASSFMFANGAGQATKRD